MDNYDFCGWATRFNTKCTDGRTIMNEAFKHNDGIRVPLVWNHRHEDPENVLGHAVLQHRDGLGVYAYGTFNDSKNGQLAKTLVQHKDITAMSIYANQLKQSGGNVMHGEIREVSLVHAGANPAARIESVIMHSADGEPYEIEDEITIFNNENLELYHGDGANSKEDTKVADEQKSGGEKTVKEVMDTLTEEQQKAVYYVIGTLLKKNNENDEGDDDVKHNVFDNDEMQQVQRAVLSHADEEAIIKMAKQSNVGSFKQALNLYVKENGILQHSDDNVGVFEDYDVLFPELELLNKGEPDTLYKYDQSWITPALAKIHKSPYSRIRTRHADARVAELRAKGYQNRGDQKTMMGQISMVTRETTPQTIYIKDALHRDDIVDITDFSIIGYQWAQMRRVLNETMILAAMVGDGRELDDPDKIKEAHIRPIWKDNEEYTIHVDVDIEKARKELQGTETGAHFGDNYVYAEAIITAALYSREKFKGTGSPDFYCTPHLVNVMLLARDLNGRRIYDSKSDLAKALNCNSIVEVEHFEGLIRTTEEGAKKKLLGLFVNLNDYTFGSTRGGEITRFEDFDMDVNMQKFLLETRLSGSLYKLKSAIALEEPVTEAEG